MASTSSSVEATAHQADTNFRVLSVQSHVVSGYVGNKSAVFPLQLHGIDVDIINTVHFSNHTGYKKGWEGERLTGEQLGKLVDGMERNDLLHQTHLLTGYIGSAASLRAIVSLHQRLKQRNPSLMFVCDPVMGDEGKLYVPQEVVDIYASAVVPLADLITPNQFECEQLTGLTIASESDAAAACDVLHAKGVATVVITSMVLPGRSDLVLFASDTRSRVEPVRFTIAIPKMDKYFTGTGDLFTALLLAHLCHDPDSLAAVCERAVSAILAVLTRTAAAGSWELRLIQSKRDIEQPVITVHAEPWSPSTGSE